nr:MAG TPA: hypothetical protein [Caudoviricetes sp.]
MVSPFFQKFTEIIQDHILKCNTKNSKKTVDIPRHLNRAACVIDAQTTHNNNIKSGVIRAWQSRQIRFCCAAQTHGLCRRNCVPTGGNGWATFNLYKHNDVFSAGDNVNFGAPSIAPRNVPPPQNAIPPHAQIHACPKFCK